MDNKFKIYKKEVIDLADKYCKAEESVNKIEKEIDRLKNIKDSISESINSLKSEETVLINKIENETGEIATSDLFISIMKMD
jgi:archaellum component FlaC